MSFLIPVKRLYETPLVFAFFHPQPAYVTHILIVPKAGIKNLTELPLENAKMLQDIFEVAQNLIKRFELEEKGYRLICNGGTNQDIPQLHFHLISDEPVQKNIT
jgi:histidine triad (HIT) family protein